MAELNRLGLIAAEAAKNLGGSGGANVGVRQADVSNSILANCYPRVVCNSRNKYRNIDGTCNNLREPRYFAIQWTPFNTPTLGPGQVGVLSGVGVITGAAQKAQIT